MPKDTPRDRRCLTERETTDAQREGFTKALEAGVRMAFGTDSGTYPHGMNASQFATMVLLESGLSFLGMGIQPPQPSWGAMLAEGRDYLSNAWWLATVPGLAISLVVLGANLLGDGLRDLADPSLRH